MRAARNAGSPIGTHGRTRVDRRCPDVTTCPRRTVRAVTHADVETHPVGPQGMGDLAVLFETYRNTRHCWCMAFCTTRRQFAAGWMTGGNRRRFETAATSGEEPMGVLAYALGEPIGWCACGPRSRYVDAGGRRRKLLRDRSPEEDEVVWLLPCLFVGPDYRGRGFTHTLARAAVELARTHGAVAIEGWPLSGSERQSDDAFVGRQPMFEELGFRFVSSPEPQRAIVRLELTGAAGSQA